MTREAPTRVARIRPRAGAFGLTETGVNLDSMPTPLSDNVSATLRADPTAALGALMVIAGAHAELFAWAARTVCAAGPAGVEPPPRVKGNGVGQNRESSPPARKDQSPSGLKAQPIGVDAHLARRRKARDRDDESLLEAIRETPEGPIGGWAEAIGKSRSSVVAALHRLRDAGLADSVEGQVDLSRSAGSARGTPKWVAPLSAAGHAHV
jgi:hypothetical protein